MSVPDYALVLLLWIAAISAVCAVAALICDTIARLRKK